MLSNWVLVSVVGYFSHSIHAMHVEFKVQFWSMIEAEVQREETVFSHHHIIHDYFYYEWKIEVEARDQLHEAFRVQRNYITTSSQRWIYSYRKILLEARG